MPRALLLFEYPTLNGGERSLLTILPGLQRAGWQFDALAPPTGRLPDKLQSLSVCLPSPLVGEGPGVRGEVLRNTLTERHYDLVHANSLVMGRISGPIVAAAGVPSIAHLRDIMGLKAAAVADLNRHARLIAVSQATAEYHAAQGIERAKLHVVYNGVDLDRFRPTRDADDLAARPARRTIGIIGQIILRKGQDVALAAALRVMQTCSDIDVEFVGARHSEKPETREYEGRLHELVAAAGMTRRVRFLGTRDDVANRIPTWTLLLHTPRQEPLGRVLLEASACGVPVVATEVGGTREIYPHGEADGAVLIAVDEIDAAAAACSRLLDDPQLAAAVGNGGRRRIEARFSAEASAAALLRQYDEVAKLPIRKS